MTDRTWSFRSVLAISLVSLILGATGTAVAMSVAGSERPPGPGHHAPYRPAPPGPDRR